MAIIRGRIELLLLVADVVTLDDSEAAEEEVDVEVDVDDDVDDVDDGGPFFSPRVSCPSGRVCDSDVVVE